MTSPSRVSIDTDAAIATVLDTVRRTIIAFPPAEGVFPDDTTNDGEHYPLRHAENGIPVGGNGGWTTSFWPGMEWIAYQLTGDDVFKTAGLAHLADFARRVDAEEDLETHDLGFLYTLAAVAPWRQLGDEEGRRAALSAANHLMTRFLEPAGIIQAWGTLSDPEQRGRTIIDSLMNLPLLSWAYEQTGEERFADAVRRHATQLRINIIREDDTTFHTFHWDPVTGEALRGTTAQGAADDSCWARGQAWGIYGFALNHRATGDAELLDAAWRCADYFLAHLPEDRVAYWDLVFTDGSGEPRDTSSAAIAVCGLYELADIEGPGERADRAIAAADEILASLIEKYRPVSPDAHTVLTQSVYNKRNDHGVEEGSLWGDYFFFEALARHADPAWRPAW